MVVMLEVEKEEKDMNCYFVSFCSVFFYVLSSCLALVRFVFGSQVCSVSRYPFH